MDIIIKNATFKEKTHKFMKKINTLSKKIEGICIRLSSSGDSNLVLTIISNDDKKQSLFVQNAKKKKNLVSYPEIFDICNFEIVENDENLSKTKDFGFVFSPVNIRKNFVKLCSLTLIIEAFDNLIIDNDENKNIFILLKDCILNIENETENNLIFRATYDTLFSLLVILGFKNKYTKKPASKNNLIALIEKIEEIIEKELKSKKLFLECLPNKK